MTSEKEAFEGDELVTETYRELGVEKAPEHLNQNILRMASGGGKQSRERSIIFSPWMKPLAWAATIGLSLAIVLVLSQVPTVTVPSVDIPAVEATREEAVLQDSDAFEKVEKRTQAQSDPNQQLISEDELGRSAASHDIVEVFSREPKGQLDAVAAPAQSSRPPLPATTKTSSARERAVDLPAANKRAASLAADSQPMASFSLLAEQSDTVDFCDATVRLSEESWLACIENLRGSGSEEAADREYEAFILKYSVESPDLEGNK